MNEVSQKTYAAFQAGAGFSMDESYLTLSSFCIGILLLCAVYVVVCIVKGIGNDSIKLGEIPSLLIRTVLLILVLGLFLFFN